MQPRLDPKRLVFIDETWTKTNMTRTRGWWRRGKRLMAKVPHGHWQTMTFLAALRHDAITAPCVLDGPINGESFAAYVEQILAPTLRPGDIVVMDNLGSHKGDAIRAVGKAAREELSAFLERPVHLFLTVKVRENWLDEAERFREMGLDFNDGN